MCFCDDTYANLINPYAPDNRGFTPEAEPRFFNAVTGNNLTFEQGMEIGRRIWNLERTIWVLQGRHRDQEVFSDYVYDREQKAGHAAYEIPYVLVVHENGKWQYKNVGGRKLDRKKFEEWKTRFYRLEGWDVSTGWPTQKTLESLDLKHVSVELEKHKKLGMG